MLLSFCAPFFRVRMFLTILSAVFELKIQKPMFVFIAQSVKYKMFSYSNQENWKQRKSKRTNSNFIINSTFFQMFSIWFQMFQQLMTIHKFLQLVLIPKKFKKCQFPIVCIVQISLLQTQQIDFLNALIHSFNHLFIRIQKNFHMHWNVVFSNVQLSNSASCFWMLAIDVRRLLLKEVIEITAVKLLMWRCKTTASTVSMTANLLSTAKLQSIWCWCWQHRQQIECTYTHRTIKFLNKNLKKE